MGYVSAKCIRPRRVGKVDIQLLRDASAAEGIGTAHYATCPQRPMRYKSTNEATCIGFAVKIVVSHFVFEKLCTRKQRAASTFSKSRNYAK